jgi:hypothetical protein
VFRAPSESKVTVARAILRQLDYLFLRLTWVRGLWKHFGPFRNARCSAAKTLTSLAIRLAQVGNWRPAVATARLSLAMQFDAGVAVLLGDCLMNMDPLGYIAAEPIYRAAVIGCFAAARGLGECLARKRDFDAACNS